MKRLTFCFGQSLMFVLKVPYIETNTRTGEGVPAVFTTLVF